MTIKIEGFALPPFENVLNVFQTHFDQELETGASYSIYYQGKCVVNLWGGYRDRKQENKWEEQTLTPIFSVTKAISALAFAILVDQKIVKYQQKVTDIWSEFGQNGKQDTSVSHILSHQAGLSGIREPINASDWLNHELICKKLEKMTPFWKPGSMSGYHPVVWGFLVDELTRRTTGLTLSKLVKEQFNTALNLNIHIGLDETKHHHCAKLVKPTQAPDLSPINPETKAAFLEPWSTPKANGYTQWLKAKLPAVNGCTIAKDLAKLLQLIACNGELDKKKYLKPDTLKQLLSIQYHGQDRVLPYKLAWCNGVFMNPEA